MSATGRTIRLEQELRREISSITDAQVRELVRAWVIAWDEIAPDLTKVLLEMLVAGEDITRSELLRSERLRKVLIQIAAALDLLTEDAGLIITGTLRDVIDLAGGAQAAIIDSQLPPGADQLVDLAKWSRVDHRQIEAIVRRSTEEITSRLRPLSDQAQIAVRRELVRGVAAGSNPKVIASRIVARAEKQFNGGLSRALTIARTETLDAHRAAAQLGQAEHADVLAGWEWIATLGPRTCPACWGQHGTMHELTEPGPLGHQNCRCARLPVVKPWAELGFPTIEEPLSMFPDADLAFGALSKAEQVAILGQRGWDAWKAGEFPRSQWAVRRSAIGWRDSFVPAKPPKVDPVPRPRIRPLPGKPEKGRIIRPPAGTKVHQHELDTAGRLASLGYDVEFLPNPHDVKSADMIVLGMEWEAKSPTGVGPSVIVDNLRRAAAQSDRAILDLVRTKLTLEEALKQIESYWKRPRGSNPLEAIWVLPHDVTQHFTLER